MAKTSTRKPAAKRRAAGPKAKARRKRRASAPKRTKASAPSKAKAAPPKRTAKRRAETPKSAADALVGLLESPLVADILAAGAAAALAAFAHHSMSRRSEGGSKQALKNAAKAAAAAMGTRLSDELDEIMKSAKKQPRSAKS